MRNLTAENVERPINRNDQPSDLERIVAFIIELCIKADTQNSITSSDNISRKHVARLLADNIDVFSNSIREGLSIIIDDVSKQLMTHKTKDDYAGVL